MAPLLFSRARGDETSSWNMKIIGKKKIQSVRNTFSEIWERGNEKHIFCFVLSTYLVGNCMLDFSYTVVSIFHNLFSSRHVFDKIARSVFLCAILNVFNCVFS